jgi:hypothetical protein
MSKENVELVKATVPLEADLGRFYLEQSEAFEYAGLTEP